MTFSIEEFKHQGLVHGGARPSQFSVYIPDFPNLSLNGGAAQPSGTTISTKIRFLAKAASLPPSNIDYIDVPYMSRKIRVNGDRTFSDWAITVMNDEDFMIRRAFEGWHQAINAREQNLQAGEGLSGPHFYKRDILVTQYGKTGQSPGGGQGIITGSDAQPIYEYTLVGAFPISIDAISLDWERINEVEQFDVTFTYDYWEPVNISGMGLQNGAAPGPFVTISS